MSTTLIQRQGRYRLVMGFGVAVTVVCSIIGVVRAMMMTGSNMDMPGMEHSTMLQGMPLADMPEMFVAGAGILLTLGGAALRGRTNVANRYANAVTTGERSRWVVAIVATAALTIDISKTSTLGFVIPGMRTEYGINASTASLLAVGGLAGTALGALLFTRLAERIGRRASYLIATLGFMATSMCGCMPTFRSNVVMCLLMGIAVGGLAPMLITMLADLFPGRSRGPVVAGLSMIATAVGYLVASSSALWLEPTYGWRVLWLIGAPTGLLLTLVTFLVPDHTAQPAAQPRATEAEPSAAQRAPFTIWLQWLFAAVIGVLTFGLTTWVPSLARAGGISVTTANAMLTGVAVVMVPCAVLLSLVYRRIGPISLVVRLGVSTAVVLLALSASGLTSTVVWLSAAVLAAALFAVNTMAAIFLPISADLASARERNSAAGTVSFFNRIGGLTGPLVLAAIVSSVTDVMVTVGVFALLCGLIASYTGYRNRQVTTVAAREETLEHA